MTRLIHTSLSPNTEGDDVRLAASLLFQPWRWKQGNEQQALLDDIQQIVPAAHVFTYASGRSCLAALLSCLNLQPNDEVLLQAFTCVAVPGPIIWNNCRPVYVDCDPDTLCMSSQDLERKITPQSKVLIIQHTFGQPADVDELLRIARQHNLFVIEDCAHALGARVRDASVGSFGDAAFLSFGRDKVISSVFGGAVVTSNETIAGKLRKLQEQSQMPPVFWIAQQLLHPLVLSFSKWTYTWWGIGKLILGIAKRLHLISLAVSPEEKQGGKPTHIGRRLPNAMAILARHQFAKLQRYHKHREQIATCYQSALASVPQIQVLQSKYADRVWLRYSISVPDRAQLLQDARAKYVLLGDWYDMPIAPRGVHEERVGYHRGSCPTAELMAQRMINLPTHIGIHEDDACMIIDYLTARYATPHPKH